MSSVRSVKSITSSKPTLEGAGVHLKRAFGYYEVPLYDPFLLLDYFGSDNPDDYLAGFPWHPHRGIETVTYVLHGSVEHGDSLGNSGVIGSGDLQWMTAGSGIIHQEMPKQTEGRMRGLQLWVNLPASKKMMNPRYQDIEADQPPVHRLENGGSVKIIAGCFKGKKGPVSEIVGDPEYLDISIPADGTGFFDKKSKDAVGEGNTVLYGDGDSVAVQSGAGSVRFLLISGKPIGEPVAWRGPIVMNRDEELMTAFEEYRAGTFIKKG
jgi:redox-sensitive bicupin YhaK (pirin superfamily)